MGRPPGYQWQPLGLDSDPVPGDPGRISQEAAHLASVAREISDQVSRLHTMAAGGADGALKGQYADTIHSSSKDLADELDKVVGRYQKVAAALNNWIPDLEQAQKMSLQALNDAEGPARKLNQTVALPSGDHLTAQQKQDVQNYHTAMKQAQGALDAARQLLGKATSLRDSSASHYASVIHSACDDSMKDSWWDSFKEWVSQYSGIIKDICQVLEIVATVLAIVALFIPGLDIIAALLWIGFGLTALAMVGRVMLAASGNGSWLDVGLDLFAMLTFGAGKLASGGLKAAADGTEALGKTSVTAERTAMVERALFRLADQGDTLTLEEKAKVLLKFAGQSAPKLAPDLAKFEGKLPLLTRVALKIGGTSEDVGHLRTLIGAAQRFASDGTFASNLASGQALTAILGLNATAAFTAGVGAPLVGGFQVYNADGSAPVHIGSVPLAVHLPENPVSTAFDKAEEHLTMEDGLSTAQVDDILRSISGIPPIPSFTAASGSW
ncbi:MAG TPA: hypothetical protein VE864_11365 [Streptosporangiaceae bacterium]|nr:hypothetical protein [Streptosporangiaceae bacterium]